MPYKIMTTIKGEKVKVKVPTLLKQVQTGDKVCKEVIDECDANEIEQIKIRMVIKLISKTSKHKEPDKWATSYEKAVWYQKHVLDFIREWDASLSNWNRSCDKLEMGVMDDRRYKN